MPAGAPEVPDRPTPAARAPLGRLRALCQALPGVSERVSHGEPSWFVGPAGGRGRQFVMFADHHHDDRVAFVAAAPDGAQERWLALDAGRFYRPPYVGGRGWIGVYLDVAQDWDDVAEIVADAHAIVGAKRRRR